MHHVLIAESTNRLLGELAMPGESKGDALRRVLGGAESWRCPPSPSWLARTVAVWLEFEGLSTVGGEHRLAAHILNNWEMVRRAIDRPVGT